MCWSSFAGTFICFEGGEPPALLVCSKKCKATLKGLDVEALTVLKLKLGVA